MTASPGIHAAAAVGFSRNAADYERARPDYPPEAVGWLTEQLDLVPGRTVADVGAGTGKLTRLLVPTGATVAAVEPVAAMRAELQRVVPGVAVHDATAERLPFADGTVDAVVCAQSFHWFATAGALHEFSRVLAPGGGLALVWNVRDDTVGWVRELTELLRPHEGDRPDHHKGEWRPVFDAADIPFGALETASFRLEQPMTPDLLVARAASMSFVGALDDPVRNGLLDAVRRLGEAQGPSFVMPYRTDVHITHRL